MKNEKEITKRVIKESGVLGETIKYKLLKMAKEFVMKDKNTILWSYEKQTDAIIATAEKLKDFINSHL